MFIRTKKRKLRRRKRQYGTAFDFVLVRSVRIDGKPRQKMIAYLGWAVRHDSQKPNAVRDALSRRNARNAILQRLTELQIDNAERIVAAVAALRPTPDEDTVIAEYEQRSAAEMEEWMAEMRGLGALKTT